MQRNRHSLAHLLILRLAMVGALALAAFAHSPSTLDAIADAQYVATYTLPDGSTPTLCERNGGERTAGFEHCSYCLLASGASLHGAEWAGLDQVAYAALINKYADTRAPVALSHYWFRSTPRAPPLGVG